MRPKPRSRMPSITGRVQVNIEIEVGADDGGPLIEGHLVEHAVAGDAGIVDENVDGAELGFDRADARLAGSGIGDVELEDRDAGLGFELVGGFVIAAVIGGNLVARFLQGLRNRGTDAAGAAGDQCNARHVFSF